MFASSQLSTCWQDLRYATRVLRRSPGFTLVALLSLALGIGANTAIFSFIDAVLIRPLPYREPDRLVVIWENNLRSNTFTEPTSGPNFVDWSAQNRVFSGLAGFTGWAPTLTGDGEPEQLFGNNVTANLFRVLGVSTAFGRTFTADESQPGRDHVVVLSHECWQRRFGSDSAILKRKLVLEGEPYSVVGVLPEWYRNPYTYGPQPELWRPIADRHFDRGRRGDFLRVVARLKPGVSVEQAKTDMTVIGRRLATAYPEANAAYEVETTALADATVAAVRRPLLILLGAVALVLLVACANVSNMLIARAAGRRKEFALRAAIGGAPGRILRQLITESLVLSGAGGGLGLLVGLWTVRGLNALAGGTGAQVTALESSVLLFAFAVSCFAGLLSGCAPALLAARANPGETLKGGGPSASGGHGYHRLRAAMAGGQMALSLIVLIAAGLLLRSFWRLQQLDLGFRKDHVLTVQLKLPPTPSRDDGRATRFLREVVEQTRRLPGVRMAAAVDAPPLSDRENEWGFGIENRPTPPPDQAQETVAVKITPGYFQAFGIPLRRGRDIVWSDGAATPKVTVVNEAMVRRYFPNQDPLGKRLTFQGGNANWITIVGVVADVRQQGLIAPVKPQVFLPHAQLPFGAMSVVARTTLEPASFAPAIRGIVHGLDKSLPVGKIRTAEELVDDVLRGRRTTMILLELFGALALGLAAVGFYGVVSVSTTQCTREIGIRMALGAGQRTVLKLILRQCVGMIAVGVAMGLTGALAATRLLGSMLFEISPADPATYLAVIAILTCAAVGGTLVPALRAIRVDPAIALRQE